MFRGFSY